MNKITDYEDRAENLLPEQFKSQTTGTPPGPTPTMTSPYNLTFAPFSFISSALPVDAVVDRLINVRWGVGQENVGTLWFGIDYTVIDHNKIQLTDGTGGTTDWTPTVQANSLGLLNVNVWGDMKEHEDLIILLAHWPGDNSPTDVVGGHDMTGMDGYGTYPLPIPPENYTDGVNGGRAFNFTYETVRGATTTCQELSFLKTDKFTIEGWFHGGSDLFSHAFCAGLDGSGSFYVTAFEKVSPEYFPYNSFFIQIMNADPGGVIVFAPTDHDGWPESGDPFKLKLTYDAGTWHLYADEIEIPVAEGYSNFIQIRDDEIGAFWIFLGFADEIKIYRGIV